MRRVAIIQSNYLPWRGYFDIIANVDEFILLDIVEYTHGDWRNRNRIKTANGPAWLTVPINHHTKAAIQDVVVSNQIWRKKHWNSFEASYRKAPYFNWVAEWLEPEILDNDATHISEINTRLIERICRAIGVKTRISHSHLYANRDGRNERLISLCQQLGATHYISGPAAKNYMDVEMFAKNGIAVEWFDYSGYPQYRQLWGDFVPDVTILDLLFNCGPDAPKYMKHALPHSSRI